MTGFAGMVKVVAGLSASAKETAEVEVQPAKRVPDGGVPASMLTIALGR